MSTSTKKTATSENNRRREILELPSKKVHDHIVAAAKSLQAAEEARTRFEFNIEAENLDPDSPKRARKSIERKMTDRLWEVANPHKKSISKLKEEFRARWFMWRSSIPIAAIVGVPVRYIFFANVYPIERCLAVWMVRNASDCSANSIGSVIDRDRTTVLSYAKKAESLLSKRNRFIVDLLDDVLTLEEELKCLSEK